MVLGSVWNFVKRHRRKFFFCGAVVGGAIILGKYAQWKLQDYQDKETAGILENARRQHHFDSNQRTCNMTVLSMLPTMREALQHLLNTEEITEQLKHRPVNKLELWEELKILSWTRAVCSVYCSSMMVVQLRVQLNIIGGYMYLDSVGQQKNTTQVHSRASPAIQHKYLENIHYLLGKGLHDLVNVVRPIVEGVLKGRSLKDPVSLLEVQELVNGIRSEVEFRQHNGYHDASPSSLCTFMLPADVGFNEACGLSPDDIMMSQLLRETADMFESSDFHSILSLCLDSGFSHLIDSISQSYQPPQGPQDIFIGNRSMPMAKLIPVMSSLIHTVCGDAPNPFMQELLMKEQVKDFAANVYEAFSQSDPQMGPA